MKKIFAFILAAAMLCSVAFATTFCNPIAPGDTIQCWYRNFRDKSGRYLSDLVKNYDVNEDTFLVSYKLKKGAEFIEEIKFDAESGLAVIVIKSDGMREISLRSDPELIIDSVMLKAKSAIKDGTKTVVAAGTTFFWQPQEAGSPTQYTVGHSFNDFFVTNGHMEPGHWKVQGDYVNERYQVVGTASYSYGPFSMEGKIFEGDKIYLNYNREHPDAFKDFIRAHGEANIEYYHIIADGLSISHTVYANLDEDVFIYKWVGDQPAPSGLEWDEETYSFKGKIRGSTRYIVSDVALL